LKTGNNRIIVDTYAWIEYFSGTEIGEKVKKFLVEKYAYTPEIVLAEIARKYIREGMSIETVKHRLYIIGELSVITGIDYKIALESGKAYLELLNHSKKLKLKTKPGLGDAIILETAKILNAKILTGDQHFKNLKITIWLKD